MKLAFIAIVALSIGTSAAAPPAEQPAPTAATVAKKPAPPTRTTKVYRLKNAAVAQVARQLNEELQEHLAARPKQDGFVVDSPVVLVPEIVTNSLIVSVETRLFKKLDERIKQLDAPSKQITIQALIEVVGADGKKRILSRPQIRTLDGQKAAIEISTADGEKLLLELTPRVVEQE